ncbi:putative RNA dependent RNA polymerase [Vicia cryptic virus]|uniref:Putative RNA dependent RNA polymerase n=1 Tax=Vicia cryptic virus TaxID=54289 RepID=Q4KUU4_9VIRU|nr:putative RNA dependent RNA polymerase [Vicia cryptic virus]AAX39023.1 putative RNA dependent RNA polymerase [Vicia cryptic virus]
MDYLISAFNRITHWFITPTNFEYIGYFSLPPGLLRVNDVAIANHKCTLERSFHTYLFDHEIKRIMIDHRRSDITEDSILEDFFAGDFPYFEVPFDEHVEYGLQCMADAFRPPRPCRPAHILDVKHGYPYKWNVNAEFPFSTDEYFLTQRKTFGEFIRMHEYEHIDKDDFFRRHPNLESHDFLRTIVPPKFGYLKSTIFSWTRRWHHIIKLGFTDTTGLDNNGYLYNRFIFPMLLHTKTAIVKKDDPNKMRTIWGASKPWIIADTMFYWEYQAWVKHNPGSTPMLWGFETFTGGWFRLNQLLFCGLIRRSFITLDWSRFDKRAYFPLLRKIMYTVKSFLTFEEGYVPTHAAPNHPQWNQDKTDKLERLWLWTLENLFEAPIILPDGRMYRRHFAGIPSGLFITQLLDSWYNYTMLATILHALGFNPSNCIIKVQGDDSIIRLNVLVPSERHDHLMSRIVELAEYYFNSIVNVKKSEIRNRLNGCEVLSYRNHNGLPFRDEIAMLAQFYHTKARDPTPEITMAQAIGFAYASCATHTRVLWVLEDIYNYYRDQGYTPNRAGLTLTFGDSPDLTMPEMPLDHFPTKSEIVRYLTCTNYRNEAQNARTWPRTLFINAPAE